MYIFYLTGVSNGYYYTSIPANKSVRLGLRHLVGLFHQSLRLWAGVPSTGTTHMILNLPPTMPQRSTSHQVTIVRGCHPNITRSATGRTIEEAIARMKGSARDLGYYDWIDVVAAPSPESPSTPGDGRR